MRVVDVAAETAEALPPIVGVMGAQDMTVMQAAVATGIQGMDSFGYMAQERGAQLAPDDPHGLDRDECGSFNLYSAESEFYPAVNRNLRNRDRNALKSFFPILKLMQRARSKLPKQRRAVWRGVRGVDMRGMFPTGREVWWWGFSSCSTSMDTLKEEQFCGNAGIRTVFMIETINGVDISRYSSMSEEAEVLLFPGTKLRVKASWEMAEGLIMIHLEESEVPVSVFH